MFNFKQAIIVKQCLKRRSHFIVRSKEHISFIRLRDCLLF